MDNCDVASYLVAHFTLAPLGSIPIMAAKEILIKDESNHVTSLLKLFLQQLISE